MKHRQKCVEKYGSHTNKKWTRSKSVNRPRLLGNSRNELHCVPGKADFKIIKVCA